MRKHDIYAMVRNIGELVYVVLEAIHLYKFAQYLPAPRDPGGFLSHNLIYFISIEFIIIPG
jgi:hypothetical protein